MPTASDMLKELLKKARAAQPLWLSGVRAAFEEAADGTPLVLRLRSFDGKTREFKLRLPRWDNADERDLVRDYLCATVYNAMSVCGGYELCFLIDPDEKAAVDLLNELPLLFQISQSQRHGLGKVVSIANRMGHAFGEKGFSFTIADIKDYKASVAAHVNTRTSLADTLRSVCTQAQSANCVGVDVGGTDIKLAASVRGRLVAVKEYDWNPAAFRTAEELIAPIMLLTRLMRACIAAGGAEGALARALNKDANAEEMAHAVAETEARLDTDVLDAVGVSFPDIVLHDRIVGGETPKTGGIRRNSTVDYETEFAKLGTLRDRLLDLCRGKGNCCILNDGSMAAYTAAMELACGGTPEAVAQGVVAHSLGTDLGTGWLDAHGNIPQLPLELYDTWLDLGSFPSAALPPEDLRSTRNENSGLRGARRYLGQSAAYRLAWELDPRLLDGFVEEKCGVLRIVTEPDDLRKPCLEHLMQKATAGDTVAEEIFRQIGRNLAEVSRELNHLLHPETDIRFLFGRFVKSEHCFALLREGFAEGMPQIHLENGGEDLANTPLMRQLAQRPDVTVAQFAQAVGALYFALN